MEATLSDRVQLPPASDPAATQRLAGIYEKFLSDRSVTHPTAPASAQLAFFDQFYHGELLRPPSYPQPLIAAASEIKIKLEQAALIEAKQANQPAPQMSAAAFFGSAIGALARSPFDVVKSLVSPQTGSNAPSNASTQSFVKTLKAAEFEGAQAGSDKAQETLKEALATYDVAKPEDLKSAAHQVEKACDGIVRAMQQELKTLYAGEAAGAVKPESALNMMNARNLEIDRLFKKSAETATAHGDVEKAKALQEQMKSLAERVSEMISRFFAGLASALGMKSRPTAP